LDLHYPSSAASTLVHQPVIGDYTQPAPDSLVALVAAQRAKAAASTQPYLLAPVVEIFQASGAEVAPNRGRVGHDEGLPGLLVAPFGPI
jgi:hypothetical protein